MILVVTGIHGRAGNISHQTGKENHRLQKCRLFKGVCYTATPLKMNGCNNWNHPIEIRKLIGSPSTSMTLGTLVVNFARYPWFHDMFRHGHQWLCCSLCQLLLQCGHQELGDATTAEGLRNTNVAWATFHQWLQFFWDINAQWHQDMWFFWYWALKEVIWLFNIETLKVFLLFFNWSLLISFAEM